MKTKFAIAVAAMTLMTGVAFGGLTQPAPVMIDFDFKFAQGDMWTARSAPDDVSFIGCGFRNFDDGIKACSFGFCQAGDSADNQIVCFTQDTDLIDSMRATSDYSFITFNWQGDNDNAECTRVGFSTQSFYLPDFATKDDDSDSD